MITDTRIKGPGNLRKKVKLFVKRQLFYINYFHKKITVRIFCNTYE